MCLPNQPSINDLEVHVGSRCHDIAVLVAGGERLRVTRCPVHRREYVSWTVNAPDIISLRRRHLSVGLSVCAVLLWAECLQSKR